ncbi:MAG: flavin reductase family protein [Verrucomicrobiota bacterium JB023]|nr:flavin reductase family protein [Verrucomicrobiota bacterium JB023]
MEIDLPALPPAERYKVLASLVTPRPIAWITTIDGLGRVNAAPFSFFNVFGSNPPLVAFAPGNRKATKNGEPAIPKDTARNIRENGEFVVHLLDEPLAEQMVNTSASLEPGEDELAAAGLTAVPAKTVSPPRIAEAPVALEGREHQTLEIGSNRMVVGIISHIYVRDGMINEEDWYLDVKKWAPVGRMASPDWYCRTESIFEIPRPK